MSGAGSSSSTNPSLLSRLPVERVVARVGLISDTHMPERCVAFPTSIFDVLRGVDLLLHAGDVGELWVLDRLSGIAPVVAVHGNGDFNHRRGFVPRWALCYNDRDLDDQSCTRDWLPLAGEAKSGQDPLRDRLHS